MQSIIRNKQVAYSKLLLSITLALFLFCLTCFKTIKSITLNRLHFPDTTGLYYYLTFGTLPNPVTNEVSRTLMSPKR